VTAIEPREGVVIGPAEIDLACADDLRAAAALASRQGLRVVFDLSATTFMDSAGLAIIFATYVALGRCREAVVLRSPSTMVRRLLRISGADTLVTIDEAAPY